MVCFWVFVFCGLVHFLHIFNISPPIFQFYVLRETFLLMFLVFYIIPNKSICNLYQSSIYFPKLPKIIKIKIEFNLKMKLCGYTYEFNLWMLKDLLSNPHPQIPISNFLKQRVTMTHEWLILIFHQQYLGPFLRKQKTERSVAKIMSRKRECHERWFSARDHLHRFTAASVVIHCFRCQGYESD